MGASKEQNDSFGTSIETLSALQKYAHLTRESIFSECGNPAIWPKSQRTNQAGDYAVLTPVLEVLDMLRTGGKITTREQERKLEIGIMYFEKKYPAPPTSPDSLVGRIAGQKPSSGTQRIIHQLSTLVALSKRNEKAIQLLSRGASEYLEQIMPRASFEEDRKKYPQNDPDILYWDALFATIDYLESANSISSAQINTLKSAISETQRRMVAAQTEQPGFPGVLGRNFITCIELLAEIPPKQKGKEGRAGQWAEEATKPREIPRTV